MGGGAEWEFRRARGGMASASAECESRATGGFAPLPSRVTCTPRLPRACPRSPEKRKKTGRFISETIYIRGF